MEIENYQDLVDLNPEGLVSSSGHYLERPEEGWRNHKKESFMGIGYHGSEIGDYKDDWSPSKRMGHIPTNGYG